MVKANAAPVLHFENVFKRSKGKLKIRELTLTLRAGEVLSIIGGGREHIMLMSRMICGQLYPDEGRIWRDGPPGPNIGLAMGFEVGGNVVRGLEMRAAAYGVDPGHYIDAIAALLPKPDVLRMPMVNLAPNERMTVLYGSTYLLPCTHFVNNSSPLPLDKRARAAVRPLFRAARKTAGIICFEKKFREKNTTPNQRILRLVNGRLVEPDEEFLEQSKKRPKKEPAPVVGETA